MIFISDRSSIDAHLVHDPTQHTGPFSVLALAPVVEVSLDEGVIETQHLAELLDDLYGEALVSIVSGFHRRGLLQHVVRIILPNHLM